MQKKINRQIVSICEDIKQFLSNLTLVFPGFDTFEHALDIGEITGFSHFDSLMLATAIEAECSIFYSEDLQHNQVIEKKLTILNPFL